MDTVEDLENVKIDYEKTSKENLKQKRTEPYETTNYKTVKEFFLRSIKEFENRPCILEKPDHKESYKEITYKEFGEDVLALGSAMIKLLNLKRQKGNNCWRNTIWMVFIIYGNACRSWNSSSSG